MECTCALLRITLTGPLRSHFYLGRNASTNINAPRSEANVYIQIQMTENEHPKNRTRGRMSRQRLSKNGDDEAREGAGVLAYVHYRTGTGSATSRPKVRTRTT